MPDLPHRVDLLVVVMSGPRGYGDAAPRYYEAGWSPLPLPRGAKTSPPEGTTGQTGRWPTVDDVQLWSTQFPDGNVGLRLPDTVVGIDVDDYDGKGGGATLAELIDKYGELPPTWMSSSRGLGTSGIRVFRIPAGVAFPGMLGRGIDVIQHHHRYVVAAPSVHPSGNRYGWYTPEGDRAQAPPVVGDLPDLPTSWLEGLRIREHETPTPLPVPRLMLAEDDDSIAERINRDHNWHDLLTADGWTLTDTLSNETRWARPGKSRGTSGVLHEPDGPFNVFSTDDGIASLQQTWAYSKSETCWAYGIFGYIAATRHNGDRSKCAREYRQALNGGPVFDVLSASVTSTVAAKLDTPPEVAAAPDEPWPEAIPLGEAEAVAKFPTEVLPTWMQPIVAAIAADLQAEPDLPGVLGLIALSTACAGKRHVVVRNSWREPLNIYAAVALPPSSGKSPAFKWMMGPIRRFEKERMETQQGQVEHVAQTRRMIERAMKKAEDKGDAQEARIQLDKLLTTPEVHPFRLVLDDATPEALVQKLYEHGQRLAILSTEGGPFGMMSGRYSDNANLDPYLKPWSNDSISVDRMGRGTTILDKPVLTIGLTVQPTVIAALAENPEMIGRGLTARFMYSVPRTNTGHRDMFWECDISDDVSVPYETRIRGLLASELDADHPDDITVERDAVLEFHGWRQGLENQRGEGGALHVVSEWTTKLESTVARVAGLLALADLSDHVDVPTMRRAIALGNYWLSHIRAVLDLWGRDDTVAKARQVVAWMTHRELSEFSVRDLYGSLRRLFPTADECRPVLHLLTERGWIRPLFDGPLVLGRRGVDSPRFAVRPSGLWINPPHARHADHVPKAPFDQNSLTHSESGGSTPLAHDTHGAHDESDPQLEVDAESSQSVTSGPPDW